MSARPLISVVIPTRNRAALLTRALDSVFSQYGLGEQFDLEVIVVDDGSTDSTATVVGEYAQVRCLHFSTSRGVAAARNAGIESSRGAFICFLDDDDVWLPGRLKLQIPAFKRHPEAGAVYSQVFDAHDGKAYPASARAVSGRIFDTLLSGNLIGGVGSVLIRPEALKKTGYFDESLPPCEDWDLWLRLSFYFPFVFVPGLVAVYLPSPRGLWQSGEKKGNNARVIEKALQMIPDSGRFAELKRAARARTALKHGQTWAEILAALRTDPSILRHSWARHYVSRWILKLALGSEAPLLTLQELCAQIKEATSDPGVSRWRVRQTVAKSWAETASSLALRPARQREAAYAATRAVALAPSLLVGGAPHAPGHQRRRALAPIIVRGALAFCAGSARGSETT
jgi:glycosyltransferase involved in cell wall biosynthesis